jgi:uncharacterized membrane protein YiaA
MSGVLLFLTYELALVTPIIRLSIVIATGAIVYLIASWIIAKQELVEAGVFFRALISKR